MCKLIMKMANWIYFVMLSALYTEMTCGTQSDWSTTADWEDTFDTFNASNWVKGRKEAKAPTHIQYYSDANAYIDSGKLVLKTNYNPGRKQNNETADWESGCITTEGKRTMLPPVKIEVIAKLPVANKATPRLHTAIWLQRRGDCGCSHPICYQEYDLMEQWDGRFTSRVSAAYHFNNRGAKKSPYGPYSDNTTCRAQNTTYMESEGNLFKNYEHTPTPSVSPTYNYDGYYPFKPTPAWYDINYFSDSYHNWTLEWEVDALRLWIDDVKVSDIDDTDGYMPYQPMALIINTACDNRSWAQRDLSEWDHQNSSIFNTFTVDYVGVFKPDVSSAAVVLEPRDDHSEPRHDYFKPVDDYLKPGNDYSEPRDDYFWSDGNSDIDNDAHGDGFNIYEMIEINVLISVVITTIMVCCFFCIVKKGYGPYGKVKQIFEDENDQQMP